MLAVIFPVIIIKLRETKINCYGDSCGFIIHDHVPRRDRKTQEVRQEA